MVHQGLQQITKFINSIDIVEHCGSYEAKMQVSIAGLYRSVVIWNRINPVSVKYLITIYILHVRH